MSRASRLALVPATVSLALLLAACAGATSASSPQSVPQAAGAEHQAISGATGGGASAASGTGQSTTAGGNTAFAPALAPAAPAPGPAKSTDTSIATPLGTPQGRIERSVEVAFLVPHGAFLVAFDRLIVRAADLGGFVLSSTTSPGAAGRIDRGSLVVKVPSAKLNDMVTGTPSSWQVSSIDYGSVDHTAETIDLTARVRAITAHRDALQTLLDHTSNLPDITTLEQQLADVQQQLDQVQGQLDSVNGRVDMATATISLSEKGAVVPATPKPKPTPRLLQALSDGWNNAVAVLGAVTLGLFSALPLLVLAALGLLAWRRARRAASPAA
jgi:uncharacterized protein DUF4349